MKKYAPLRRAKPWQAKKPHGESLVKSDGDKYQWYEEGWTAAKKGGRRHDNPYLHNSEAYEWWRVGFLDMFWGTEFGENLYQVDDPREFHFNPDQ